MKNQLVRFYVVQGYAGKPKAGVNIDGVDYVIDDEHLRQYIEKAILEKGFTISQSKRQKYPRVTIND
jgi:hypothetical protein